MSQDQNDGPTERDGQCLSRHTPGPWLARYGDRVTRADDTDGSKSIAHVYGWREHPEQQEANQKLIAAAPELLDVLKRLSSFDVKHQGAVEGPYAFILKQARDAIAKAEGRPVPRDGSSSPGSSS